MPHCPAQHYCTLSLSFLLLQAKLHLVPYHRKHKDCTCNTREDCTCKHKDCTCCNTYAICLCKCTVCTLVPVLSCFFLN